MEKLPSVAQINTEPKRSHQWFLDAGEMELFPNKKRAVQVPSGSLPSGPGVPHVPLWQNSSSLPSISNQYIDQLFRSDARAASFADRNMSLVGGDNFNIGRKEIDNQVVNDSSVVPVAHMTEDAETNFSYGGTRRVKVNQVMDSDNGVQSANVHYFGEESEISMPLVHAGNSKTQANFISIGQPYDKVGHEIVLMGHTYTTTDVQTKQTGPVFGKDDGNSISLNPTYHEDSVASSFSSFNNEPRVNPVEKPIRCCDFHDESLVCASETPGQKELEASASTMASATPAAKPRHDSVCRSKPELKSSKKEDRNRFPSNVRSLISTGILDGVPVKYISVSKEELHGIVKDSGYLCGCQSCNYSKVLNAYEFERHACCKSKHPNNHIYFENGKTIYGIVQELRSTPESLLFDAIQTITGSPINQKSFRVWKESFQAATRELQRIYGKEELNR
ncbi:hypothetical protein Ancab_011678 [Ancistrocladus abbreviatus]